MIKNVIFDCGRVLIHYDEHYIASHFAKTEEDISLLATVAMSRKYWEPFDEGTLDRDGYLSAVRTELPTHLHDNVERLYDGWIGVCPKIEGMAEIVRDCKKNCHVYLLSNFHKRLRDQLHDIPILLEFDGLVISGEVKVKKPNPAIYQHLLDAYKLNPAECIFIDDLQKNLDAASEFGIQTYLFDGDVRKLRAYLTERGVIL